MMSRSPSTSRGAHREPARRCNIGMSSPAMPIGCMVDEDHVGFEAGHGGQQQFGPQPHEVGQTATQPARR
jgi:hypothetical protein